MPDTTERYFIGNEAVDGSVDVCKRTVNGFSLLATTEPITARALVAELNGLVRNSDPEALRDRITDAISFNVQAVGEAVGAFWVDGIADAVDEVMEVLRES